MPTTWKYCIFVSYMYCQAMKRKNEASRLTISASLGSLWNLHILGTLRHFVVWLLGHTTGYTIVSSINLERGCILNDNASGKFVKLLYIPSNLIIFSVHPKGDLKWGKKFGLRVVITLAGGWIEAFRRTLWLPGIRIIWHPSGLLGI